MRLYIDLTADEEADIHGWVNYYLAHPTELPTRIVLSDRSAARLQQITAQFQVAAPPPPPPPPPGDYEMVEHPWGRRFMGRIPSTGITVRPIHVPMGPFTYSDELYMVVAEADSPPTVRQVSISTTPGDFTTPLARGEGVTAGASIRVTPGATYYFNVRHWSSDLNAATGVGDRMGVVMDGQWPR